MSRTYMVGISKVFIPRVLFDQLTSLLPGHGQCHLQTHRDQSGCTVPANATQEGSPPPTPFYLAVFFDVGQTKS